MLRRARRCRLCGFVGLCAFTSRASGAPQHPDAARPAARRVPACRVDVLGGARRLGAERPEQPVPCPVCGASAKGKNVAKHLDKHPGAVVGTSWSGRDKRIRRPFAVALVLGLAGAAGAFVLNEDAGLVTLFVVVALGLLLTALEATSVFRARLWVDGDDLALRFALGLGRRSVPLRSGTEVGSLFRVRPASTSVAPSSYEGGVPTVEEGAGAYVALVDGRRRLTVGCKQGTGIRRHWQGWAQGERRKYWDITLEQGDFVALQHVLAQRGTFQPR